MPNESAPQEGETTPPDSLPVVEPLPVETVPVDSVPVDSVPVDSVPVEVPTEVATLVDVRADLWWAWDDDGSVWLLPAYTFTDTEGRVFTVPAVTDEFLIIADPVLVDPMPPAGRTCTGRARADEVPDDQSPSSASASMTPPRPWRARASPFEW